MKNSLFMAAVVVFLAAPEARAVTLDTQGTGQPVPPPVVTCSSFQDFSVTSFADVLAIRFTGYCTASFPGTNTPPTNAASYEASGTWDPKTGTVHEGLKGPDGKGQSWQINSSGTCQKDPWMTGSSAAGCGSPVVSASPNAPLAALRNFTFPVSAGILDAQARGVLTVKTLAAIELEHKSPSIEEPKDGATVTFPANLVIFPYIGTQAQSYAVEWQAAVNNAWTPQKVFDQAGLKTPLPADKFGASKVWRVRVRAYQSANANWTPWNEFFVEPKLKLPIIAIGCNNTAPYGATYDVSGMPGTLKAGSSSVASIKVTNMSNQTWGANSNYHLSYHWAQNGVIVTKPSDGLRTILPSAVPPCGTVVLQANVKAQPTSGAYQIQWDMLLEGTAWFSSQGVPTGNKAVTVTP